MNKCIFMGRLTRDPEIVNSGETKIGRFSLAVDRRFKGNDGIDADFFNMTAFGKLAGFVESWLTKGTKIVVECRAQNHNYTDKNNVKRYEMQFIADSIEFAESRRADQTASPSPVAQDNSFIAVPDDVDDDELPFG